ncbi:DUF1775 domain-containing protein [Brevibacillus fluminis]|uniref:DUF1775 domain-containing protein n=1 Tax=Brevibacillus fluminis TaxID=511487 RepID=A0A3M8D1L7_9BACL|nr:YcnI family protein [Brevibacillus fluminis]RNB81976.1 DUF1775 domain-containing protein [Brevibacillus fluminis]
MKVQKWLSSILLTGAILTLATTAQAHVNVYPKETTTGAYEKYTVRVPVEKDVNTTKVRLEFPDNVKVSTVMPIPGWDYAFEKDSEGRNKAITWTATAGGIKSHEFMEFAFVGANPKETGSLTWKAYQTYADGETVEWTGDKDSKTPASVTTVNAGAGEDDHGAAQTAAPAQAAAQTGGSSNTLPTVLAGLALLVAIIGFFRKKA